MFHANLQATFDRAQAASKKLPEERLQLLAKLTEFVQQRVDQGQPVHLNFICTHNSRRSHLSQIWAAAAATHYGIKNVTTYSGGTEATAFNPRAVAAIERDGFVVQNPGGDNPHYKISMGPGLAQLECFSKTYDDPFNTSDDFAAVMTCNHADQNCPAVLGAARISLPYDDPKAADDTPEEAARYTERSAQIASEMIAALAAVQS